MISKYNMRLYKKDKYESLSLLIIENIKGDQKSFLLSLVNNNDYLNNIFNIIDNALYP